MNSEQEYKRARDDSRELTLMLEKEESGSAGKTGYGSISGHIERTESYRQRDP